MLALRYWPGVAAFRVSRKMESVLAIFFDCLGFGLVTNAFSTALAGRFSFRIASGGMGIVAMEIGVFHFAAARGIPWATSSFRHTALAWSCGLFMISLFLAWIFQH